MDLRHLRSFVALAADRHFTRAASRLNLTQQALSNHIRQLEATVGAPLFVRTTRHTELTEVGRAMLASARRAVDEADQALRLGRASARAKPSSVRVGVIGYAPRAILPTMAPQLNAAGIELELAELSVEEQLRRLRSGELDLAMGMVDDVPIPLASEVVYREHLLAILPRDHRLASQDEVSLAELAHEELVLGDPVLNAEWNSFVHRAFRHGGVVPRVSHDFYASLGMALTVLDRGDRCGLLTSLAATMNFRNVVMRPITPRILWTTLLLWDPARPSSAVAETVATARRLAHDQHWTDVPTM